jgi:hypothetical protein
LFCKLHRLSDLQKFYIITQEMTIFKLAAFTATLISFVRPNSSLKGEYHKPAVSTKTLRQVVLEEQTAAQSVKKFSSF